jgi:cell division protein DivIC
MAVPQNPWQALRSKLPRTLQNRYYLATVIFLFFLIFIDKNDLITQIKLRRALNRLEDDRVFYQQKIKEAREEAEDFELTKENYAREHYYMKQNNEDVFVIQK